MKRVTIRVGERPFRGGADMSEYEVRRRFGAEAMEIDAVPGRYGGSKNARFWTERRRCVVAQAKTITIVWSASILA